MLPIWLRDRTESGVDRVIIGSIIGAIGLAAVSKSTSTRTLTLGLLLTVVVLAAGFGGDDARALRYLLETPDSDTVDVMVANGTMTERDRLDHQSLMEADCISHWKSRSSESPGMAQIVGKTSEKMASLCACTAKEFTGALTAGDMRYFVANDKVSQHALQLYGAAQAKCLLGMN